jgi:hypothetical protein
MSVTSLTLKILYVHSKIIYDSINTIFTKFRERCLLNRILDLFFWNLFVGFCGFYLYTNVVVSNGGMVGEVINRDVEGSIHNMICLECLREIMKNLVGIAHLWWIKCELWNWLDIKHGDCLPAWSLMSVPFSLSVISQI